MTKYIVHTRNKFLRCMCAIYMAAFCSLYLQIPGLYGEKGILPAHTQLKDYKDSLECLSEKKTLLCFRTFLGLNMSYMMELIALVGTLLSFLGLVYDKCCTSVLFGLLWVLYSSLFQVGQTFLHFQWDTLLLDVGFITIFVAPLLWNTKKLSPWNMVTMWVVRWALFRLMFASGVVKLQSGCPTWWGLTALNIHYESQCIPTPLAWYAHQLPEWWQKLCVVATFVIEIPIPFLFFSPWRSHRIFSFYAQVLLQVMIILTGNYNFFNLLTLTLCMSLLDDQFFGYQKAKNLPSGFINFIRKVLSWCAKWAVYGVLAYYSVIYFSLKVSPDKTVTSKIAFTREDFDYWMTKSVPVSVVIGTFSLLLTITEALMTSLFEGRGCMKKIWTLLTVVFYSGIAVCLAGVSLVPFTVLHPPSQQKIWPVFRQIHEKTFDFNIVSSYGLFRHMTGVGGRPEIVMEGANDVQGPWIEYQFPYKPGSVSRKLPFVAPHQPRVDWQMWFAALGTYHQNPWLISMTHRFLIGEKSVTALLDRSSPWRSKAPKYIRVLKYIYRYTSIDDSPKQWWTRESAGEYMPIFSVDHPPLIEYLRKLKLIDQRDNRVPNKLLAKYLDKAREVFNVFENHLTLLALFLAALVIALTNRILFK